MTLLELKRELSNPRFQTTEIPTLPRRSGSSKPIKNAALTNACHEALTQASAILNCPINQFLEIAGLYFLENLTKSKHLDEWESQHLSIILAKWKSEMGESPFIQRTSKKRNSLS